VDDDFHVILMGGDKVFIKCYGNNDVLSIYNDAVDFFSQLFHELRPWTQKEVVYEKSA
jgi:hypothetical protein